MNPNTLTTRQTLEVIDYLSDALVAVGHANMMVWAGELDTAMIAIRNQLDQMLEQI